MTTIITKLARASAILGGLALSALIVLTCVSIVGRSLNSVLHSDFVQVYAPSLGKGILALGVGPINGDFELVQAGMAFAIFAFLPLCQLNSAHASVDIFTSTLPARINQILRLLVEIVFAAVLILIAVQLFAGMESKLRSGQTTLLLQYPVWWGYAICVPSAAVAALVAAYVATSHWVELATGRPVLPPGLESGH